MHCKPGFFKLWEADLCLVRVCSTLYQQFWLVVDIFRPYANQDANLFNVKRILCRTFTFMSTTLLRFSIYINSPYTFLWYNTTCFWRIGFWRLYVSSFFMCVSDKISELFCDGEKSNLFFIGRISEKNNIEIKQAGTELC